jgi:hypothetical protein
MSRMGPNSMERRIAQVTIAIAASITATYATPMTPGALTVHSRPRSSVKLG